MLDMVFDIFSPADYMCARLGLNYGPSTHTLPLTFRKADTNTIDR